MLLVSKNAWLPQFSFWIPIPHAKICFSRSHKPSKNTSVLVGTVLNVGVFIMHTTARFKGICELTHVAEYMYGPVWRRGLGGGGGGKLCKSDILLII